MLSLKFYTRKECALCHSAWAVVQRVQKRIPFLLESVDIDSHPELCARYGTVIPVVAHEDTELARSFVDEKKFALAVQKLVENQ